MTVGPVGEIGSGLERSPPVNIDLSRQQARSVTSTLPTRRSQVNYHRHESSQPYANAPLRADARGRDGGIREKLAAGVAREAGPLSGTNRKTCLSALVTDRAMEGWHYRFIA